ncbi:chloroplast RNA-binding protein 33 [Perilla frutescens var. frutescens]|nr:chloroplast RNA-binding protein 33 [Perilla frutescens var. frutescens]
MTSAQLSEIFAEAGRVVSAEIVYNRVTDRSRGFSFVIMGSVEEAKEAIRLFDGAQIGGRTAKVNVPEVPGGGEREVMTPKIRISYEGFVDSPYKIYAGNLSWSLTSQTLREAFAEHPGFLSAKVIYDRDSGRSRGFGLITFSVWKNKTEKKFEINEVKRYSRITILRDLSLSKMGSMPSMRSETVVHDAGHMVPMDQPKAALEMLQRWMKGSLSKLTAEQEDLVSSM